MSRSDLPTARLELAPVVLVVGCPQDLVLRCRDAAIAGQALVVEADVASAATMAAKTRPLVIVMLADLHAFDADSFDALASDVRARLVTLPSEGVSDTELENLLVAAISEAEASRDSLA